MILRIFRLVLTCIKIIPTIIDSMLPRNKMLLPMIKLTLPRSK
jgi:hypothetical protein